AQLLGDFMKDPYYSYWGGGDETAINREHEEEIADIRTQVVNKEHEKEIEDIKSTPNK
ncbi:hypothetical protein A2U01_0036297, partial [Trifolium medium]|nr:hypothetical protein [Trifolium medium]